MINILWKISFESTNRGSSNLALDNWDKIRMIAYKPKGSRRLAMNYYVELPYVKSFRLLNLLKARNVKNRISLAFLLERDTQFLIIWQI